MLSSSSSTSYETQPTWWKSNFTTTFCAALSTAFVPSSNPLSQDISSSPLTIASNNVEKRTNNIDHHYQCE
ncbi:unnamed protein product [Adineta steineri]|uniref:Uncharacterized protein n=1 Tax=Adineta steineri TaxID=433720 RepID=A0A814HHR8_9BILA|nr:unnamed protein product [Adineta steineri]